MWRFWNITSREPPSADISSPNLIPPKDKSPCESVHLLSQGDFFRKDYWITISSGSTRSSSNQKILPCPSVLITENAA